MIDVLEKTPAKTRYSDSELQEFKEIIFKKIKINEDERDEALRELQNTSDQRASVQEGGSLTSEKESLSTIASRATTFINQLKAALVRIENKTYGICRKSNVLIPKERLMAVPHTTLTMEEKVREN
ncbi:MAG: TraR/DksA family transcriptional regulator [Candidatus Paceibacterota bacterium]